MATQQEFNQFVMDKLEQMDLKMKEVEAKLMLATVLAEHANEIAAFLTKITPILDQSVRTNLELIQKRHEGQRNRANQVVQMFTNGSAGNA